MPRGRPTQFHHRRFTAPGHRLSPVQKDILEMMLASRGPTRFARAVPLTRRGPPRIAYGRFRNFGTPTIPGLYQGPVPGTGVTVHRPQRNGELLIECPPRIPTRLAQVGYIEPGDLPDTWRLTELGRFHAARKADR